MVVSLFTKDGSFLSPPLDATSWVFILFCYRQNISFVPVHIPGKLNVVADQGPSSTEWMLDPWSFESICQEFLIFPTVVLFCLRATSRLSYSVLSMAGFHRPFQDALDSFLVLFIFSFLLCLPSSGTLAFSFQGNCSVQGSHAFACSFDFEQYMDFDPGLSRRITFYWYSDYSLCEIIAPVEWSFLDSIFIHIFSLSLCFES